MLETINTVPILRLISQFRVSPRIAQDFPQGKFVKAQTMSSLSLFRNASNVLIICVMTNFPWGKRGENVVKTGGKRGEGRGKELCAILP